MSISITNRNVDLEADVKEFIHERVSKIEQKYRIKINSITVVLDKKKYVYHAEIRVQAKDLAVVGNGKEKNNIYRAVEEAVSRIETQLKKHKEKVKKRKNKEAFSKKEMLQTVPHDLEDIAMPSPSSEEAVSARITVRQQPLHSLTVAQAVRQFDEGFQDGVLLFINSETEEINVLYKNSADELIVIQQER